MKIYELPSILCREIMDITLTEPRDDVTLALGRLGDLLAAPLWEAERVTVQTLINRIEQEVTKYENI